MDPRTIPRQHGALLRAGEDHACKLVLLWAEEIDVIWARQHINRLREFVPSIPVSVLTAIRVT